MVSSILAGQVYLLNFLEKGDPKVSPASPIAFESLYQGFQVPITALDCGPKCAPYNERGVPFCCDTRHAVPTAYDQEWRYLQANTNLWHRWQAEDPAETRRLESQTPENQVLIECLGHEHCQRGFRAITCRAFPFFPYITSGGQFLGMSYYWEYEDRCWVISNLQVVTAEYRGAFIATYDRIFTRMPAEQANFAHHSREMRKNFQEQRRAVPLLHRNGSYYKISPGNERARRVTAEQLPKFGPYLIAAKMPFPDEMA